MRALNAAELLYLQGDLRIMKGSTAFYVFERPGEGEGGGSAAKQECPPTSVIFTPDLRLDNPWATTTRVLTKLRQ